VTTTFRIGFTSGVMGRRSSFGRNCREFFPNHHPGTKDGRRRIYHLAIARNLVRVLCIRREFHIFAARKSSPVTNWMRALCRDVQSRHDGMQVGTLGMCPTGNFALTLMAGKGHALLTAHWSDEAYDKMMAYFGERFDKAA